MAKIIVIDDDLAMDLFVDSLRNRGNDAYRIGSSSEALKKIDDLLNSDLLILDIIMAWPSEIPKGELDGSRTAGMEILRQVRKENKNLKIIAYSATQDGDLIDALNDDPKTRFISKWDSHSIRQLNVIVYECLGQTEQPPLPIPFIVHGHDDSLKLALKNYLQNTLHLPEPVILHEQPNCGRTLIEKFEDYSTQATIVFVLLTPDDVGESVKKTDDLKRRARQNVIFEMGYFVGILGRRSGRVILLYKGQLELPSDLIGITYIDVTNGVEAVGEQIRQEVANVK